MDSRFYVIDQKTGVYDGYYSTRYGAINSCKQLNINWPGASFRVYSGRSAADAKFDHRSVDGSALLKKHYPK